MSVTIKTNNHWRELISFYELSPDEQANHDHDEDETGTYFRYKGYAYNLGDFVRFTTPWTHKPEDGDPMSQWDGVLNETAFSGVLVKLSDCGDGVKVARYYG